MEFPDQQLRGLLSPEPKYKGLDHLLVSRELLINFSAAKLVFDPAMQRLIKIHPFLLACRHRGGGLHIFLYTLSDNLVSLRSGTAGEVCSINQLTDVTSLMIYLFGPTPDEFSCPLYNSYFSKSFR